jgi:hypothetical protein
MAELEGAGLADAGAVVADGVTVLMICFILEGPVLAGTAIFSGAGALGAGCSGAAGVACPVETGVGSVRTSGTSAAFPFSMPAFLSLAPTSSAVSAPLVGAPVSGHRGQRYLVEPPCPCGHRGQRYLVEPPSPCGRRGQSCLVPAEDHPSPGKRPFRALAKMPAPERCCGCSRYVGACGRGRLIDFGASTGARGMFRCNRSPEREKGESQ